MFRLVRPQNVGMKPLITSPQKKNRKEKKKNFEVVLANAVFRLEITSPRVLKKPDWVRPDPSDPWPRPAPTRPVLKSVGPVTR
jgi:hypothetical protein